MPLFLFLVFLLAACGGDSGDRGPVRPEPPELPTGEAIRSLTVDETTFDLYANGDCLTIVAAAPGMQPHVDRHCSDNEWVTDATESCGWFADESRDGGIGCDIAIPRVLYGKVTTPNIGWVCVGQIPEDGPITSVRFLEPDDNGHILDPALPDESYYAHLYTPEGVQYGESPLDAPSSTIYDLCALRAPWGKPGPSHEVLLQIELTESLQHDGVTVFLDAGAGPAGMSGSAAEAGEPAALAITIPASSPALLVKIEVEENQFTYSDSHEWPEEVRTILASECNELLEVEVRIGGAVLAGHTEVELELLNEPCSRADQ